MPAPSRFFVPILLLSGMALHAAAQAPRWSRHVMAVRAGAGRIAVGDISGDGKPDLAAALPGEIAWFDRGLGAAFWPKTSISARAGKEAPADLKLADLDGDGDLDLIAAYPVSGELAWYENPRLPLPPEAASPALAATGATKRWTRRLIDRLPGVLALALEDIDRDRQLDLAAGAADGVWWYPAQRNPADLLPAAHTGAGRARRFWRRFPLTRSSAAAGLESLLFTDMDGDGDRDLVAAAAGAAPGRQAVNWWEHPADGTLIWSERLLRRNLDPLHSLTAADLNRDGRLDLLAAGDGSTGLFYFTPGEEPLHRLPGDLPASPVTAAAADLDQDGDIDVAAGGTGVTWWSNDGRGGLTPLPIDASQLTGALIPADVDGDGDIGLFIAAPEGGDLAWYENLGQ